MHPLNAPPNVFYKIYYTHKSTLCLKKPHHPVVKIISANLNRFSKFFYYCKVLFNLLIVWQHILGVAGNVIYCFVTNLINTPAVKEF